MHRFVSRDQSGQPGGRQEGRDGDRAILVHQADSKELVVWPATLVVSMASENRAMLGRRERQYWRSIGATEDNAAVARLCLATFGSDLLPSRSRTRFAAARTDRTLRGGALKPRPPGVGPPPGRAGRRTAHSQ